MVLSVQMVLGGAMIAIFLVAIGWAGCIAFFGKGVSND